MATMERVVLYNRARYPRFRYAVADRLSAVRDWPSYLYDRYVYERPSNGYRKRLAQFTTEPEFLQHATALCRDGVVILRGYIGSDLLQALQCDFEEWCQRKPEIDDNGFKDFDGAKGERFLESSIAFSTLAVDPYITALASYYWGKPIRLAYAHGYRLEPVSEREYRAFQWHHDLKRKQIKAMILLTDVPADGQRMDYIPGSHTVWHRFTNHRDVRFTREQALRFGNPIPCYGPAGTVVVFDTNGIHRGNRNPGPRRDQYTFNYTAGKALFSIPGIHPRVLSSLSQRQKLLVRNRRDGKSSSPTRSFRYLHDWLEERFLLS